MTRSPSSSPVAQQHGTYSIRTRLLITVGTVLMLGLVAIVWLDYRAERAGRLQRKQLSLQDEADVMLPAVQRLATTGPDAVQDYIDAICARMRESTSPGHHIAVRIGEEVLQADAHERASPDMLRAMERAAASDDMRATVAGRPLLVGSVRDGDVEIYASEFVSNVLAESRSHLLWQSTQLTLLGLLVAAVAGLVLVRVVTRPVERLASVVQRIGEGELGLQVAPFGTRELSVLAESVNGMSKRLADAEKARRRELEKARRIQDRLLPSGHAPIGWDIASFFDPADAVGGDFFDYTVTPSGRLVVAVADVTGHGIPAALGAAVMKVLLGVAVEQTENPGEILTAVNRGFAATSATEQFASMAVACLDPKQATLQWASAGHEICYRQRPGGELEPLNSTGFWIGVEADTSWETQCLDLRACDRLVLLTDGLPETQNGQGELLGRELLCDWLSETADLPPQEAVSRMLDRVGDWSGATVPTDDRTLLILEPTRRRCS